VSQSVQRPNSEKLQGELVHSYDRCVR
jgi:hypothetical protein